MQQRTAVVVITGAVSLLASTSSSAAPNRPATVAAHPAAYRVPVSVNAAHLVQRKGVPSHVVRRGSVGQGRARRLAHDIDRLNAVPKGTVFACPVDRGSRRTVTFRADGHSWTVSVGSCGSLVTITRDQRAGRMFHNSARYTRDLRRALHALRPAAEWVPRSVNRAHVTYRRQSFGTVTKRRTVRGSRATALVTAFDGMAVEPSHAVSCNVAGGPSQTVTFRTSHHRWTAVQSTCTGVEVARDHKRLPTLTPDRRWDRAVRRALRSPA